MPLPKKVPPFPIPACSIKSRDGVTYNKEEVFMLAALMFAEDSTNEKETKDKGHTLKSRIRKKTKVRIIKSGLIIPEIERGGWSAATSSELSYPKANKKINPAKSDLKGNANFNVFLRRYYEDDVTGFSNKQTMVDYDKYITSKNIRSKWIKYAQDVLTQEDLLVDGAEHIGRFQDLFSNGKKFTGFAVDRAWEVAKAKGLVIITEGSVIVWVSKSKVSPEAMAEIVKDRPLWYEQYKKEVQTAPYMKRLKDFHILDQVYKDLGIKK